MVMQLVAYCCVIVVVVAREGSGQWAGGRGGQAGRR